MYICWCVCMCVYLCISIYMCVDVMYNNRIVILYDIV